MHYRAPLVRLKSFACVWWNSFLLLTSFGDRLTAKLSYKQLAGPVFRIVDVFTSSCGVTVESFYAVTVLRRFYLV